MRFKNIIFAVLGFVLLVFCSSGFAQSQADVFKQEAIGWVEANEKKLDEASLAIWEFAEPAWREQKSSKLLADMLERDGFTVVRGVADIPTAFVATYGSGKPVIGILAEYDALPGLSQKAYMTSQEALLAGAPGHGCGHNLLGVASVGAAMAAKAVMEKHKLPGTIKLFGCPAEEILAGKVFMAKAGVFKGLDVCFEWHPRDRTLVYLGSSLAMNSFEVTFHGKTAHGSGDPWEGRSALDAVELMDVGVNFLREHMKPTARIHYVIPDGGRVPNVVPDCARVWYFVRDKDRQETEYLYDRVLKIAQGAAIMTETTYEVNLITGVYELLINKTLAEVLKKNLATVGAPQFSEQEQEFAKRLQKNLGKKEDGLSTKIDEFADLDEPIGGGSTDVGDVSWLVPLASMGSACWPQHTPGHSWGMVSSAGSSIGLKGMKVTAKTIAATVVDVLMEPGIIEKARTEFKEKTQDFVYKSAVPKNRKPPLPE